jgi:hypothetical protein
VAGELVAGFWVTLSVVFADFTEDVSANVQSAGLLLCLVG